MDLNVSTTMFENRDMLRNMAKNILNNGGASKEAVSKIVGSTLFANEPNNIMTANSQLAVLQASTQITISNSLKETLKYLKTHANKKAVKKHILGEIWDIYKTNNDEENENEYKGELIDFQIDENAKNIFAA